MTILTTENDRDVALLTSDASAHRSGSSTHSVDVVKNASIPAGHYRDMVATTITTLLTFVAFFVQGVIVARILGPEARGEFGKILYFPRDLFLYVGLLGAIDVIAALAVARRVDVRRLRFAAWRLAWFTSLITAAVSLLIAAIVFTATGKAHLLPLCVLIVCFLPLEHTQLIVGAVDRGRGQFFQYNWQRLLYAFAFPIGLLLYFGSGLAAASGWSNLSAVCVLFVVTRLVGVLPTWWNLWQSAASSDSRSERNEELQAELTTRVLIHQGRPSAWSLLATECFERLDLLLIVLLASFVEAGYYFVAVPAAALLTIVPNALSAFAYNAGARSDFAMSRRRAAQYLGIVLGVQVVAAIGAYLTFPALIRLIFGTAFEPAIVFALWLLPASALRGYLQFVDAFLRARGWAKVGIRARLLSMVLMLAFVGVAFTHWGLVSIPLGAALGQLWSSVIMTVAAIRVAGGGPRGHANNQEAVR